ncbi:hypothetical protein DFP93_10672 [Aneurinibacillus soli]|uniref:Uncharacterized protein n=1 Tax=Aneurinibacillus soli TaxID=1500254 RepID=A0A0U5B8J2_9BACL|nr:hypothetical protein DFP93_10672 [Aneurinibacillus soli]BAU29695.1 hypothetical protein CB4_03932 [Aneurinibacillus soli]
MNLYVCLSCFQVKRGDPHRVDLNVCENCAQLSENVAIEPKSTNDDSYPSVRGC